MKSPMKEVENEKEEPYWEEIENNTMHGSIEKSGSGDEFEIEDDEGQ
jgi:hypothetical protein